jgi:hypothetical protein
MSPAGMQMKTHQYRVTIEHLSTPDADEPLDKALVFETTSSDALMLLFIVNRLRAKLGGDVDNSILDATLQRRSTRPL